MATDIANTRNGSKTECPLRVVRRHCECGSLRYSAPVTANAPVSVGLCGDGDEIAAIDDVERAFGIKLDYSDAPQWQTAGAVFDSVQKALPTSDDDTSELWERFAAAICGVNGVDPTTIERGSLLLSHSRLWARLADVSAVVWVITILAFVIVVTTVALTHL